MRTSRSITVLAVGALVACNADTRPEVVSLEQSAQQNVYHSTQKGGGANVSFGDNLSWFYLDAWQSGTGKSISGYVNFQISENDPTSEVCNTESYCVEWQNEEPFDCLNWEDYTWCYYTRGSTTYGWGALPKGAFDTKGSTARLDATLGPDCYVEKCTFDELAAEPWTCSQISGGVIKVSWLKDGNFSSLQAGTSQYKYGAYSYRTSGTYSSFSAEVSGELLGKTFANAYGSITSSNGAVVGKDVYYTPK